jgi:hypothetical protein
MSKKMLAIVVVGIVIVLVAVALSSNPEVQQSFEAGKGQGREMINN